VFLSKTHKQTILEFSQGDYISATAESFLVDHQAKELSRHTTLLFTKCIAIEEAMIPVTQPCPLFIEKLQQSISLPRRFFQVLQVHNQRFAKTNVRRKEQKQLQFVDHSRCEQRSAIRVTEYFHQALPWAVYTDRYDLPADNEEKYRPYIVLAKAGRVGSNPANRDQTELHSNPELERVQFDGSEPYPAK